MFVPTGILPAGEFSRMPQILREAHDLVHEIRSRGTSPGGDAELEQVEKLLDRAAELLAEPTADKSQFLWRELLEWLTLVATLIDLLKSFFR